MPKRLICTRADDNIQEMCSLTHPLLKAYAKRCNADFMILSHKSDCLVGDGRWHYRIMVMGDLLNDYDTIAHIDSDIIPNKGIPDIFEAIGDNVGTIFEDVGSRQGQRRRMISEVQNKFGLIDWLKGYINTGVFVVSKKHQNIFRKINGKYWEGWGWDDVHLGYQINRFGYEVKELTRKWNWMTMFSESWNDSQSRFSAYLIHYAGQGIFDPRFRTKIENMKHDYKLIYEH